MHRTLALLLLVSLLPAPAAAQDDAARVRIVEPAEGAIVRSSTLALRADVVGAEVADWALVGEDAEGVHFHWTVDGRSARGAWPEGHRTADPTFVVTGLRPGPHTIAVELRRADHGALDPPARATVNVTVSPDAPYVRFRDGQPSPGERSEGGTTRAAVDVERAGGLLDGTVEVRWTLDGEPLPNATGTVLEVPAPVAPGVRLLRAELVTAGEPLDPPAYDEVLLDVPALRWTEAPANATGGADFAAVDVPFALDVEGWDDANASVRVTVDDGEPQEVGTNFTLPLEVGEHEVVAVLLGADGSPVAPTVALRHTLVVEPPPPEVRFVTPNELVTLPPTFLATVEVSNFTIGDEGPVPNATGHLHWYLDGALVDDGTNTSHRFEDLGLGVRTLEVRLALADHTETGVSATRRVGVEPAPTGGGDEAQGGENGLPGPGVLALLAVAALAARRARR